MRWHRYAVEGLGYECSSAGDRRFSALFARLPGGATIEEAYQLDVKGYRTVSDDWRDGKGKPPLNGKTRAALWIEYLDLWRYYLGENPELFAELRTKSTGKVLTDRFATSEVNQAHALSYLISEAETLERLPFSF